MSTDKTAEEYKEEIRNLKEVILTLQNGFAEEIQKMGAYKATVDKKVPEYTTQQIFASKLFYNKWMEELKPYEVQLIIDMMEEYAEQLTGESPTPSINDEYFKKLKELCSHEYVTVENCIYCGNIKTQKEFTYINTELLALKGKFKTTLEVLRNTLKKAKLTEGVEAADYLLNELNSSPTPSVDKLIPENKVYEIWQFADAQLRIIKDKKEHSKNHVEIMCLTFTANCIVDIMDTIADILEPVNETPEQSPTPVSGD